MQKSRNTGPAMQSSESCVSKKSQTLCVSSTKPVGTCMARPNSFERVQVPLHGQISPAYQTTTVAEHREILNNKPSCPGFPWIPRKTEQATGWQM